MATEKIPLKYPGYFKASDGCKIFFNTNFPRDKFNPTVPCVVLNYGLVCSTEHWREQIPFFEDLGYQLLIYNYRGHYNSAWKVDENMTFARMALDLFELCEFLGVERPFVMGHSMGVNVTLEYAKLYPENTRGIVLVSGTVLPPHDVMFRSNIMDFVIPQAEAFSRKFPKLWGYVWNSSGLVPLVQKMVLNGGFNREQVPLDFIQKYLLKMGSLPPEIFFHFFRLMKDHDIINFLEEIDVPALVVGGDKDQVVPNYLQEILVSKLPRAEFYLMKEGSHVPIMDFPELVNERVERFICMN